ncbi:MAG: CDP-alcohol phosphatidyltransferase family protein [Chloroflexia bacterium]
MGNFITAARVVLLFITVGFIYLSLPHDGQPPEPLWAVVAAVLTLIVFVGDAVDGMVARARGEASALGAVIDIAGDRIVENVYWVVMANIGLISVWFPLIMLVRSFLVDALRTLALREGMTAFGEKTMMRSRLGVWLAASRFHRGLYGSAKVVTFIWLILQLAFSMQITINPDFAARYGSALPIVQAIGAFLAVFTLLYSLARGAVVIWDSRHLMGVQE